MHWEYPGRKQKATGFFNLKGSPYRDDKGFSQLISYLHGAIINAVPRMGGVNRQNLNCINSLHI